MCSRVCSLVIHTAQTVWSQHEDQPGRYDASFCVFEINNGYPLRRHLAYSRHNGYYGGMLDSVLTLRSVCSVDLIYFSTNNTATVSSSSSSLLKTTIAAFWLYNIPLSRQRLFRTQMKILMFTIALWPNLATIITISTYLKNITNRTIIITSSISDFFTLRRNKTLSLFNYFNY